MKASVIRQNGSMKIKINNEIFNPQCFRSFRPEPKTIREFAKAGFRLTNIFPTGIVNALGTPYSPFGEVWIGEGKYNWENLHKQVDMFIENAPEAYFMLMVQLDTRDWFLKENPDVEYSFTHLIQTAGCEKWRKSAARFMCDMIDHLDEHYPEKIYAVMLCAGYTNEWSNHHPEDCGRHSRYKQQAYKNWCGDQSAVLPSAAEIEKTSWGVLRHPVKNREGVDYWQFHHDIVTDTVKYFARIIKEHTHNTKLVAVAQGYLMMYRRDVLPLAFTGLWETLECEDIDIFAAPASYWFRGLDNTSSILYPVDSFALHNKLYIHSLDNTTHLTNDMDVAKRLQSGDYGGYNVGKRLQDDDCGHSGGCTHVRLKNLNESGMYFRRETALALSKGMGYWWFGMYPQWHDNPDMMTEIKEMREVGDCVRTKDCQSVSEIAVFVDQDSNYYMDAGQVVTDKTILRQPGPLYRMGAPWDNYHMDDINHPEMSHDQYKFYVFLNLLAPKKKHLEMIEKLKKEGKSMLFLYAAGIITEDGFSIDAMSHLTGVTLKELDEQELKIVVVPGAFNKSAENSVMSFDEPVVPMFFADDADAEVIGRFEKSQKPSFVMKKRSGGSFDAWSAMGSVQADALRELARRAGVFIYLESGDPLYLNKSMLGCFGHKPGKRSFKMPFECKLYECYSGKEYQTANCRVDVNFKTNEMKLFKIIPIDVHIIE